MDLDQSYALGPYFCENPHHALLHHVLSEHVGHWPRGSSIQDKVQHGVALEFGVGSGDSLCCMARYLPVIGFDSFQGLPEDWRPGFGKGMFRHDFQEVLSRTPQECMLVPGLFENTLPGFNFPDPQYIKLVHFDADLYTSTAVALAHLDGLLTPGCYCVFDEWHSYPGCEEFEQRAWREFVERTGIRWEVIGHGVQQWAIRIVA